MSLFHADEDAGTAASSGCNLSLICVSKIQSHEVHYSNKYKTRPNSLEAPNRLLQIMAAYTDEAKQRSLEMNEMRFMYEESPYYEQGYILGEIIERFRKVIEHANRPLRFKSDNFQTTLKRTEQIQILYFETYHLVRMMHEIPKKFDKEPEYEINKGAGPAGSAGGSAGKGKVTAKVSKDEYLAATKNIEDMQRRIEREKRKRRKQNAKLREMYIKNLENANYGHKKEPYNKWWPIDYGWEIDYRW